MTTEIQWRVDSFALLDGLAVYWSHGSFSTSSGLEKKNMRPVSGDVLSWHNLLQVFCPASDSAHTSSFCLPNTVCTKSLEKGNQPLLMSQGPLIHIGVSTPHHLPARCWLCPLIKPRLFFQTSRKSKKTPECHFVCLFSCFFVIHWRLLITIPGFSKVKHRLITCHWSHFSAV